MQKVLVFLLVLTLPLPSYAKSPTCDGPDNWAAAMAHVHLKNSSLIDNSKVDFSKTKVVRLASEKVGPDLYRQIHRVVFAEKSGGTIEVITSNEASNQECSMSGVEVFVISRQLGP